MYTFLALVPGHHAAGPAAPRAASGGDLCAIRGVRRISAGTSRIHLFVSFIVLLQKLLSARKITLEITYVQYKMNTFLFSIFMTYKWNCVGTHIIY